jgi:penicillin-binding protein 1A
MNISRKKAVLILLIGVAILFIFFLIIFFRAISILESKKEILNYKNAAASVVLSDDGSIIGKIFTENRTNISYNQIPDFLVKALVATEDARFFEHRGVDSRSLLRVFFKTILLNKESSGGGSTITQQLAKNMFGRIKGGLFPLLVNKIKELMLARRLERLFSKEEILALYLNTVPFGENVYGIEAASLRYFNKRIDELNMQESAVLVGMLKANNIYNPRLNPKNSIKRRNLVFRLMVKYNYLSDKQADSLSRLPLKTDYLNLESGGPADYFIFQIKKEASEILKDIEEKSGEKWNLEEDGLIITTTLNLDLQESANKAFQKHLSVMQKRLNEQYRRGSGKRFLDYLAKNELRAQNLQDRSNEKGIRKVFRWEGTITDTMSIIDSVRENLKLLQAGLIAMEPVTGDIKAWVGGIDFRTQPYDQIYARRQMGSTLKPLIYAAAFEQGISPCDYLDNDSIVLEGYEDWHPANFDNTYGGKYSLTGALVHSMNIPTLNLFMRIGFNSVDSLWKKMGFSFSLANTPSLAFGTSEANILELAVAYAAFSNGGLRVAPRKLVSIKTSGGEILWQRKKKKSGYRVLSEKSSQMISYILQKAVNQGTGSPLRYQYGVSIPVAGKTGTSQDYTDAWFAAYNPSLVIISRVGAAIPAIHFNNSAYGTGSALALPLVGITIQELQKNNLLVSKYAAGFPEINSDISMLFDCPDYRESDVIDTIRDFFRRNRMEYDSTGNNQRKKPSFFKRIFGKHH